jgi:hypothetical protein
MLRRENQLEQADKTQAANLTLDNGERNPHRQL